MQYVDYDDCNLRLTSISRIPRLKTEMQPEFSQWGGQTPTQRLFVASDDGLPRAAGPRGACCRRVCARAGAGSRRIVLRWGARVVGGLWRRGEGAVVWCLLTPSFRAAARKRVLGRFQEVFSRSNRGICKQGAREPSPTLSPPGSLAHTKLTEWFGRYRPVMARFLWCLSTPSSCVLLAVPQYAERDCHLLRATASFRAHVGRARQALVCPEWTPLR